MSPADLENALTDDTALVSLMWANNETGVIFPVREIAELCRAHGTLFHCDAVQAIGKTPVDVSQLPVDYLSLTGHKFNAPKGVGALYIRRGAPFSPLLHGGHQERGLRGGTENVALIAALGEAAELAMKKLPEYEGTVHLLRDALEAGILTLSGTELNGHKAERLANTSNITFHGIESEALLLLLDQEGIWRPFTSKRPSSACWLRDQAAIRLWLHINRSPADGDGTSARGLIVSPPRKSCAKPRKVIPI